MWQASISKAREVYRSVATRGAMLYFLIDSLNNLDRVYHYSMAAFVQILKKGGSSNMTLLSVQLLFHKHEHA